VPADFSKRRRRIYQDKLTATAEVFQGLLLASPFDAQKDVGRMQGAVTDPELIEALAGMLDTYALYGVSRDFERLDETKALLVADASQRLPLDRAIPPRDQPARTIANPAAGLDTDALIRRYFDWYIDVADVGDGRSGVAAFLARYPLLGYAMKTVTGHHQHNVSLACERISADWDTLGEAFFPGDTISKLSKIRTTGSDFHKGGKQVLILSFSLALSPDPGRVVYKPSPVEIDCRIAGNSAAVNKIKPQGYTQSTSLTEVLNRYTPSHRVTGGFTSAALPTYTVLPFNRDSLTDAYGYIEFLHREPEVDGPFTTFSEMLQKQADKVGSLSQADVQSSDWVVADWPSERVFYHQAGRLLAMAYAVSVSDLHVQNVIAHGKSPCLIDLEDALKHPMATIAESGLSSGLSVQFDPEGRVLKVNDKVGGLPRAEWVDNTVGKPATSRLYRWTAQGTPGTAVGFAEGRDGALNRRALLRGLIEGVEALADPNCQADVKTWVSGLDKTIVRFVAVATADYAPVGRDLFQKCCETEVDPNQMTDFDFGEIAYTAADGTKTYLFPDQVVKRRRAWEGRYAGRQKEGPLMQAWRAPPFFALEHPDHAWRDFLNCDVPSFYHALGSPDLLNSAGAPVDVAQAVDWQSNHVPSADAAQPLPQGWQANPGGAYLPEPPIDMIVSQLESLAKTCQDPAAEHLFLVEAFPGSAGVIEKLLFPDAARLASV
jgi:hypothetical protein